MVRARLLPLCAALVICLGAQSVLAQRGITFSVDFQGPTGGGPGPMNGRPDGWSGIPMDEGSILTVTLPGPPGPNPAGIGPQPPPSVLIGAIPGAPGFLPGGLGVRPGVVGAVEVDAISYGCDRGYEVFFSVDEFARGIAGSPLPPNVATEGSLGAQEASADIFYSRSKPMAPPPPGLFGNTQRVDGNGLNPAGMAVPGLGLIEPNPPSWGQVPDPGDNLDALDMNAALYDIQTRGIFFSLDSHFADPFESSPPCNSGTAVGNGFVGGDVLWTPVPGVAPVVWLPANALGLDLVPNAGPDSDDLDALALDATIYPVPPAWPTILFSVRRGSAVIGQPDSLYGAPIEEGDILTMPVPGGLSPYPSIWMPAEAMGLFTRRQGLVELGDDLDALDLCPHAGDANYDRIVDVGDLGILAFNWNQVGKTWEQADYTGDGIVDVGDLGVLAFNWNWTYNPMSPVPEPASLSVLLLAALAGGARRLRRN